MFIEATGHLTTGLPLYRLCTILVTNMYLIQLFVSHLEHQFSSQLQAYIQFATSSNEMDWCFVSSFMDRVKECRQWTAFLTLSIRWEEEWRHLQCRPFNRGTWPRQSIRYWDQSRTKRLKMTPNITKLVHESVKQAPFMIHQNPMEEVSHRLQRIAVQQTKWAISRHSWSSLIT